MIEEQIADEMKEENGCSAETGKNVTPDDTAMASSSSAIGIRPKPVIRKPENASAGCKSEPLETKWQWAPGAWQDATRTSAFQPYKPPTLLTNLQRGNTQTQMHQLYAGNNITFHMLAGQGELMPEHIQPDVVDETDEKGLTGLMWAAGYGQLNSVRQLLKCGADVNYRGPNSETTLHLAAAYGHHDVVKILLNHGADPNACDEDGNTPLIYGAYRDHPHVCYELLTRGAEVTMANSANVTAYKAATMSNSTNAKVVIENYLIPQILTTLIEDS